MYLDEELGRGSLRVPVRRMNLELHTVDEPSVVATFLVPHGSPQRLFEDATPFLPAERAGRICFYARSAIVRLVVDAALDVPGRAGAEPDVRSIAVHLRDGSTLTGALRLIPGLPRPSDVLNHAARSFALHAGGKIHHIAKAHVSRVEELP